MLASRPLTLLMSLSLSAIAVQARAEQAPVPEEPPGAGNEQPATGSAGSADWTWFGMGFESRQERFRRDMDAAVPGVGGSAGSAGSSAGGGGQGGGK